MRDHLNLAKQQLDLVIQKGRVHLYKPIQLAEILYRHRTDQSFDLNELEDYRRQSKRWRDEVSTRLVGRVSTSSARFQDNLFEANAMPPDLLSELGIANENDDSPGIVEAYIYSRLGERLDTLSRLTLYLEEATPKTFDLKQFLNGFTAEPGLRRSIDKAFEIVVYALFDTLVQHLQATVSLSIPPSRIDVLREFEDFTSLVLGITVESPEISRPARLYRVGVTNAADRGLDMWANYGPAVQVKHVTLSEELAEDVADEVAEHARIVIVCRTAEKTVIERVVNQTGFGHRIQGVVTQADLEAWYGKCFTQTDGNLGEDLIQNLRSEFEFEFPSTGRALVEFQEERAYDSIKLDGLWRIDDSALGTLF